MNPWRRELCTKSFPNSGNPTLSMNSSAGNLAVQLACLLHAFDRQHHKELTFVSVKTPQRRDTVAKGKCTPCTHIMNCFPACELSLQVLYKPACMHVLYKCDIYASLHVCQLQCLRVMVCPGNRVRHSKLCLGWPALSNGPEVMCSTHTVVLFAALGSITTLMLVDDQHREGLAGLC